MNHEKKFRLRLDPKLVLVTCLTFFLWGTDSYVSYPWQPINPPLETPFDDGINVVLYRPLRYQILDTNFVIIVPKGFVTDYASVPKEFHSFISPRGPHGSPAIIHDFLYWDQSCTRQQADEL